MNDVDFSSDALNVLQRLREALGELSFPFETPLSELGNDTAEEGYNQLGDYILPRMNSSEAPLLCVIGGSTGSGKSAILNALIGEKVSRSSAIRPTTREPVLVHSAGEGEWFTSQRILPQLTRVTDSSKVAHMPHGLHSGTISRMRIAESSHVPAGVAFVDSPDIDSVISENRLLAGQLLQAADVWIFVTTAARYADAIPWALLDEAAQRNAVIAVVLNRVPAGVSAEIRPDVVRRLQERGLGSAPLFVIMENSGDEPIHEEDIAPLRAWVGGFSTNTHSRMSAARHTLSGAVESLLADGHIVCEAYDEQVATVRELIGSLHESQRLTMLRIEENIDDGNIVSDEVLARWVKVLEYLWCGGKKRRASQGVAGRFASMFKKNLPYENADLDSHIENALISLLLSAGENMASDLIRRLESSENGEKIAQAGVSHRRTIQDRREAAQQVVTTWQERILAVISEHTRGSMDSLPSASSGSSSPSTSQASAPSSYSSPSHDIHLLGVALKLLILTHTPENPTDAQRQSVETRERAHQLVKKLIGEGNSEKVSRVADKALNDFLQHANDFLTQEAIPYESRLSSLKVSSVLNHDIHELYKEAAIRRWR
ncbi:dynamin family protein [Actinotignum urinale]|uniref:Dynamin family protein n=1 Tax=Actinotignum urinale TaxID=190146 RepID=A0ABU5G4R1_9ACTO|nr:dynamin family protein [Actinotignum urinale]MDY5132140.1 dynamin family protein [Actinotignum urinale]